MKEHLGRLSYPPREQGDFAACCQSFKDMAAAALVEWKHSELLLKWQAVTVRLPSFLRAAAKMKSFVKTCRF